MHGLALRENDTLARDAHDGRVERNERLAVDRFAQLQAQIGEIEGRSECQVRDAVARERGEERGEGESGPSPAKLHESMIRRAFERCKCAQYHWRLFQITSLV